MKYDLDKIINDQLYITCVTFMGGDADHKQISELADSIRDKGYKVAMYSGLETIDEELVKHLDYYKIGRWDSRFGPLNCKTTNQHLYKIIDEEITEDITYMFWPK